MSLLLCVCVVRMVCQHEDAVWSTCTNSIALMLSLNKWLGKTTLFLNTNAHITQTHPKNDGTVRCFPMMVYDDDDDYQAIRKRRFGGIVLWTNGNSKSFVSKRATLKANGLEISTKFVLRLSSVLENPPTLDELISCVTGETVIVITHIWFYVFVRLVTLFCGNNIPLCLSTTRFIIDSKILGKSDRLWKQKQITNGRKILSPPKNSLFFVFHLPCELRDFVKRITATSTTNKE